MQQAILLEVDGVSMVALCSSRGIQIWQIEAKQRILDWSASASTDATSDVLYGGIAMVQAEDGTCVLCVGDSLGRVHAFAMPSVDQAFFTCTSSHHQTAIVALASSAPDSSRASNNILASCDDTGSIALCTVASTDSIEQRHSWEGRGMPCISLAAYDETLIAGYYDGVVHLYNMVSTALHHHWQKAAFEICVTVFSAPEAMLSSTALACIYRCQLQMTREQCIKLLHLGLILCN